MPYTPEPPKYMIRASIARSEQRKSLADFIMKDTALMQAEGYVSKTFELNLLRDELNNMTMEELQEQMKASVITASCR